MLSNKPEYEYAVYNELLKIYKRDLLPKDHVNFLEKLKSEYNFEPKVCYDIGSAVLHWTRHAERIWPGTQVILFDAFEPAEILYKTHKYNIGVLSDEDNKQIKFYQNDFYFGGNSYYKEYNDQVFPESGYINKVTKTLDTLVKEKDFPYPDLIKIDVQGAELDILKGASKILANAKYLIVELQDVHYNKGAPLADTTIKYLKDIGWKLIAKKFSDNGPDGDYCFYNTNNYKLFIVPVKSCHKVFDDYFKSLLKKINVLFDNDSTVSKYTNVKEVVFVCSIHNKNIFDHYKKHNYKIGFLNTEPLNINIRLEDIIKISKIFNVDKIYDYSLSNIYILKTNGIDPNMIEHLPYNLYKEETDFLLSINNKTKKIYDYGIISGYKLDINHPITHVERRGKIIDYLISKGFKVNLINGWDEYRDRELAKCHVILNIHGCYIENDIKYPSNIFEHIRCDRLLEAGYNILSEESYMLDENYIQKYKYNLKIISYDDFFNINKRYVTDYEYIFYYGIENKGADITYEVYNKCVDIYNNVLTIPKDDLIKTKLFGDPIQGCDKNIYVYDIKNNNKQILYHNTDFSIKLYNQKTQPIKIIDCFIFYNELELLNYRLNALNDVVDYFVIVESTHTFTGKEKQLYLQENLSMFEKFKNKIIHVIVDDFPYKGTINYNNNEQWINEKFQRNCIGRGLDKLCLNDKDIITICDVDEIPDPQVLAKLRDNNEDIDIKRIELDFYYYNLNCKKYEKWPFTKILSYSKYKQLNTSCDNIRFMDVQSIKKAGWHLSYFGNAEFIKNKLLNFSHQEYNNEKYFNTEMIQDKIETSKDLFGRIGEDMNYIDIYDNDYLPPLYEVYLKNYYKTKNNL